MWNDRSSNWPPARQGQPQTSSLGSTSYNASLHHISLWCRLEMSSCTLAVQAHGHASCVSSRSKREAECCCVMCFVSQLSGYRRLRAVSARRCRGHRCHSRNTSVLRARHEGRRITIGREPSRCGQLLGASVSSRRPLPPSTPGPHVTVSLLFSGADRSFVTWSTSCISRHSSRGMHGTPLHMRGF